MGGEVSPRGWRGFTWPGGEVFTWLVGVVSENFLLFLALIVYEAIYE
jgi:hypothetical protein